MFARRVTLELKPHALKKFSGRFRERDSSDPAPPERVPGGTDSRHPATNRNGRHQDKESAEAYHREFYPEVAKLVAKFADGTPIIRNFEVEYATYRKFATVAV